MDFKPVNIKREKKNSLFLRESSKLIQFLAMDEPALLKVFITRVNLSNDYKFCYIYFSTYTNQAAYNEALEVLKLYKSSLRRALAQRINGKYMADLVFMYDDIKDKERHINDLLDKVAKDLPGK